MRLSNLSPIRTRRKRQRKPKQAKRKRVLVSMKDRSFASPAEQAKKRNLAAESDGTRKKKPRIGVKLQASGVVAIIDEIGKQLA